MEVAAAAAAASSNPCLVEPLKHKNHLQEFAQKSSIPLPLYQTVNEGYSHKPQFRSTVMIDGTTFRSHRTFAKRKEAEQDVAKLALEGISRKIKHEGIPLVREDIMFCKSILREYAVKMDLEMPTYTTTYQLGGRPSMFTSSLVFDGKAYTAVGGKNKKLAEQMAARTVIESILAESNTRTFMAQIVKSKGRLNAVLHKGCNLGPSQDENLALRMNNKGIFRNSGEKEVLANSTDDKLPGFSCSEIGQLLANAAVTIPHPPEAQNLKEEFICKPWSGVVGSDNALPNDLAQCNQGNDGIPLVGSSLQHYDTQCMVLDSERKRSNEDQGRLGSKKTRTDGGLQLTPPAKSESVAE